MKILVTGGTGMLGSRIVEKLSRKNDVIIFSRNSSSSKLHAKVIFGDLKNYDDVEAAFVKHKFDAVYHLAANMDESDPKMYYENVIGTRHILELCKKHNVSKIIFMGSCGATGYHGISKEDSPYHPNTKYEKSKADSEKLVIKSGIYYTIIRSPIVIGPNEIWSKIIKAAQRGYPIIGSGKNNFHLAFVDDVVNILVLVLNEKRAKNQVFNVATKDTKTYEEVYTMICKEIGVSKPKKHVPIFIAITAALVYEIKCMLTGKKPNITMMRSSIRRLTVDRLVSTEKAKKILDFSPKYTTNQAIISTIMRIRARKML